MNCRQVDGVRSGAHFCSQASPAIFLSYIFLSFFGCGRWPRWVSPRPLRLKLVNRGLLTEERKTEKLGAEK
jgi:hypothetical protein